MTKYSVDRFARSCGGSDALKIHVEQRGVQRGNVFSFSQPFVLIGSHERADIRLDHPDVSQRQLYLQLIGGRLFAVHLSTRVPTCWGEEPSPSGWVEATDSLRFGPFTVRYLGGGLAAAGPAPPNPLSAAPGSGPRTVLELLRQRPEAEPARGIVDRALALIGHQNLCKVRIRSPHVSSVHCSLVQTGDGLWAVDLCGRGGIRVNGVTTRCGLLEDGDQFEVGSHQLRILSEPSGLEDFAAREALAPLRHPAADEEPVDAPPIEALAEAMRVPAGADAVVEALLDRFEEMQAQTFEQFQEVLTSMMRTFGALFNEHRDFVRGEMDRFEELARALSPGPPRTADVTEASPTSMPGGLPAAPPANTLPPAPSPMPTGTSPVGSSVGDEASHLWLQQRIEALAEKRESMWRKLTGLVRGRAAGQRE